jgi:O-succinylbenzoic acid--CoA ligase
MNISWESAESYLFLNPSYSKNDQRRFYGILEAAYAWPAHVWLSTSGSSVQKWVGLSKQALLASAQAVNQHLNSSKADRWVNALPSFHVGGLGVWARAYLSGAKVYDFKRHYSGKWRAEDFYGYIQQIEGTLSALVPTQLYDLVTLGKQAPASLRALIIGGGTLLPSLYERAVALGWPVLPSYGLTECASQVATATLESWQQNQVPPLQLLPHLQACEQEGHLCFAGSALLSTYAYFANQKISFVDPKVQGWLISEDRGMIQNGQLHVLGRADAILKIGGENVDLACLENHLQTLRLKMAMDAEVTLIAMPDTRLGHSIYLVSSSSQKKIKPLVEQFQQSVLPFERIRKICFVPQLPRSPLGKILKSALIDRLSKQEYFIDNKNSVC